MYSVQLFNVKPRMCRKSSSKYTPENKEMFFGVYGYVRVRTPSFPRGLWLCALATAHRPGRGGTPVACARRGVFLRARIRESAETSPPAPRSRVSHPRLHEIIWLLPGRRAAGRGAGGGNTGRVSVLGDRPSCVESNTTRQQGGRATIERTDLSPTPTHDTHTQAHT